VCVNQISKYQKNENIFIVIFLVSHKMCHGNKFISEKIVQTKQFEALKVATLCIGIMVVNMSFIGNKILEHNYVLTEQFPKKRWNVIVEQNQKFAIKTCHVYLYIHRIKRNRFIKIYCNIVRCFIFCFQAFNFIQFHFK